MQVSRHRVTERFRVVADDLLNLLFVARDAGSGDQVFEEVNLSILHDGWSGNGRSSSGGC